jgi:hypothetical protein
VTRPLTPVRAGTENPGRAWVRAAPARRMGPDFIKGEIKAPVARRGAFRRLAAGPDRPPGVKQAVSRETSPGQTPFCAAPGTRAARVANRLGDPPCRRRSQLRRPRGKFGSFQLRAPLQKCAPTSGRESAVAVVFSVRAAISSAVPPAIISTGSASARVSNRVRIQRRGQKHRNRWGSYGREFSTRSEKFPTVFIWLCRERLALFRCHCRHLMN